MCEPPEEEDENDEDYFGDDDDDSSPTTNAAQTLDVLALSLPPEKLITHVVILKIIFKSLYSGRILDHRGHKV